MGQGGLSASDGNAKRYYCGLKIGLESELGGYWQTEVWGSALVDGAPSSCKDKIQLQNKKKTAHGPSQSGPKCSSR